MTDPRLFPCFLGPYGENDGLLEKLTVEFLRDHVYWRRNFHPEDPPAIPTHAAQQPDFMAFEARLRRELHTLSAALKRSVPFHSPRYLGHMVSDLALPGLAAQMLTLPYNPNNVSEDAAPVTIDLEIRVGLQLARLFGYEHDPARTGCAFGHLTSGGTVANYQALRLALALKAFPVALRAAAPPGFEVPADDRIAFNLAPREGIALLERWRAWVAALAPGARRAWRRRVEDERIEQLGMVAFFARHPTLAPPVVLAPVTAHYSWSKGMKLLGLGRGQLLEVPERGMRLDTEALDAMLDELRERGRPVLLAVAVLGTTEFGTIDPVHEVVASRERAAGKGLGFGVHVDAAWGGYLATIFRAPDGSLRPLHDVRAQFATFPSAATHAAMAALPQCDSITVDPHKMGYLPYGAGAFVCRDQRAMALLAEDADYVFAGDGEDDDYFTRFRKLGRFIPEGSKSGAAAAAVYVTHQVLPLDHEHFGRLPGETIRSTGVFLAGAARLAADIGTLATVCIPFAPDSNIVCLAFNPAGNADVARMNAFMRALYEELRCDPGKAVQAREFYASMTTLRPEALGAHDTRRVLAELGLDASTLSEGEDADRLVILRHTLMNPFLDDAENGISYIDRYFAYLARRVRALLPPAALPADTAPRAA